jgi:hypothetical protein
METNRSCNLTRPSTLRYNVLILRLFRLTPEMDAALNPISCRFLKVATLPFAATIPLRPAGSKAQALAIHALSLDNRVQPTVKA